MALSGKKTELSMEGMIEREKKSRDREARVENSVVESMKDLRERVQGRGGREAGIQQDGKTEENKNPLNFSQQQLRNLRPNTPSIHPLLPPCTPHLPLFFSRVTFF